MKNIKLSNSNDFTSTEQKHFNENALDYFEGLVHNLKNNNIRIDDFHYLSVDDGINSSEGDTILYTRFNVKEYEVEYDEEGKEMVFV